LLVLFYAGAWLQSFSCYILDANVSMLSEVPRDVGRSEIAAEKKSGNPSGTLSSLPLNQSLDAPCSEVTDKECTAEDPENTGWWN